MITFIRSLIFYAVSLIGLVSFSPILILLSPFITTERLQYLITFYNKFVLLCSRYICGLHYKIEGLENIKDEAMVVMSNHQSSLETFILPVIFGPLSTVLKKELLMIPFFSWGAKKMQVIAVDRSNPIQAYKQLIREGAKRISDQRSVLIFPEGTRVAENEKVKFNRGGAALAHHTKAPIIPVAHNTGRFIKANRFPIHSGVITIRIGKAIEANNLSKRELYETSTNWIESQRDILL